MENSEHKFPTEIVKLPSQGLHYAEDNVLSKGEVEIKYMTAKEEDILSTESYINQGIVLDKLCESIIVTKGVNYNDLLIGDKNAILIAARIYGYGPKYKTSVTVAGGRTIPVEVDLQEVPHKEFEKPTSNNTFSFHLPKANLPITFKLMTVGDQKKIDASLKGLQKIGKPKASSNLTTRLRHIILSVDGDDSRKTVNEFVGNMLAIDSRAFREHIQTIQPDIDIEMEVEDPESGATFRGSFKIGLDLLYPDYKG